MVSGALPLACRLCATASAFDPVAGAGAATAESEGAAVGVLGAGVPVDLVVDGVGLDSAVGSVVETEIDGDAEDEPVDCGAGALVDCVAADVPVSVALLQAANARTAVSRRPVKEALLTTAPDSCDWISKSDSRVKKVLNPKSHGEHLTDLGEPNTPRIRVQTWLRRIVHDFPTTSQPLSD